MTDIKKKVKKRKQDAGYGGGSGQDIDIPPDVVLRCLENNVAGDAEIFKKFYALQFVYNASAGVWLHWSGHYWDIDFQNRALSAVGGVADVYLSTAAGLAKALRGLDDTDPNEKILRRQINQLKKRAFSLRDVPRGQRVLTMAAAGQRGIVIKGENIDQKPWLLPCKNGVVNLRTGNFEPGQQSDFLMRHCPIEWAGIGSPCPTWEKTLAEIYSANVPLVDYIRRLFGCAVVGDVLQSFLVVLTGIGRNGKSLIIETLSKVMGQLAGPIRPEMLLDGFRPNSAGPTPDIMALFGKRLVFASETDDGSRVSPSRVKWLTGKDTITGRNPHDKYEVTFKPSHTLFLLTNHKPRAPADDFAFWERVVLIPHDISFVDRDPVNDNERRADHGLSAELEKELPGILAWMVRGCLEWQDIGLAPPVVVKEAVAEYRREEDLLGDFISDCCVIKEGCSVTSAAVYDAFKIWWQGNVSHRPPSAHKFGKWFGGRFERQKTPYVIYVGVGLLAENPDFDLLSK